MQDLENERHAMRVLAERMLERIDPLGPPKGGALAPLRWEFMRRLFPLLTLEQLLDNERRASANELMSRWRSHTHHWTSTRISAEWAAYARDVRALLQRVRAHCAPSSEMPAQSTRLRIKG